MKCAQTVYSVVTLAVVHLAVAASTAWAQGYVAGKPEGSINLGGDSSRRSTPTLQPRAGSQNPGALRQRSRQPIQPRATFQPRTRVQPRTTFQPRRPTFQPSRQAIRSLSRTIQSQVQRSVRRAERTNRAVQRQSAGRGPLFRQREESNTFVRNPWLTPRQQKLMETEYVVADDIRDSRTLDARDIGGDVDPPAPASPTPQNWSTASSPDPFNPRRAIDQIDDQLIKALEQRELARERFEHGGGYDHDLDAYRDYNDKIKALQDERIAILRQYAKNPQALRRAEQDHQATRGLQDSRYRGVLDSRRPTEAQRSDWLNDPNFRQ